MSKIFNIPYKYMNIITKQFNIISYEDAKKLSYKILKSILDEYLYKRYLVRHIEKIFINKKNTKILDKRNQIKNNIRSKLKDYYKFKTDINDYKYKIDEQRKYINLLSKQVDKYKIIFDRMNYEKEDEFYKDVNCLVNQPRRTKKNSYYYLE